MRGTTSRGMRSTLCHGREPAVAPPLPASAACMQLTPSRQNAWTVMALLALAMNTRAHRRVLFRNTVT